MSGSGAIGPGQQKLISGTVLKSKYELWPLIGVLSFGCVLATAYTVYSVAQKPDVRLNRKSHASPPWEDVDPEKSQKLITFNQKYSKIPELEQLRKEIGSYKY